MSGCCWFIPSCHLHVLWRCQNWLKELSPIDLCTSHMISHPDWMYDNEASVDKTWKTHSNKILFKELWWQHSIFCNPCQFQSCVTCTESRLWCMLSDIIGVHNLNIERNNGVNYNSSCNFSFVLNIYVINNIEKRWIKVFVDCLYFGASFILLCGVWLWIHVQSKPKMMITLENTCNTQSSEGKCLNHNGSCGCI